MSRISQSLNIISNKLQCEHHQPPVQRVSGALSPAVKQPGREDDHSLPSSAEVKNAWHCTSSQYAFMTWCLVKQREKFTLTFTLP